MTSFIITELHPGTTYSRLEPEPLFERLNVWTFEPTKTYYNSLRCATRRQAILSKSFFKKHNAQQTEQQNLMRGWRQQTAAAA